MLQELVEIHHWLKDRNRQPIEMAALVFSREILNARRVKIEPLFISVAV
jgi:hypothetical protein